MVWQLFLIFLDQIQLEYISVVPDIASRALVLFFPDRVISFDYQQQTISKSLLLMIPGCFIDPEKSPSHLHHPENFLSMFHMV